MAHSSQGCEEGVGQGATGEGATRVAFGSQAGRKARVIGKDRPDLPRSDEQPTGRKEKGANGKVLQISGGMVRGPLG